jgi:hypothetical protein
MIPEKDYKKVSITQATSIPDKGGFYQLYKNRYWQVTEDNCIIFYLGHNHKGYSPQCNPSQSTAEHFAKKEMYPWKTRVELIENVFISHDCSDFM